MTYERIDDEWDLSDAPGNYGESKPLIKEGHYWAWIVEADDVVSKSGNRMIALVWELIDGPYDRRTVRDRIMREGSPKAIEIARNQTKTLLAAAGYPNPNLLKCVDDLRGLACFVKVGVEEGTDGYPDKNVVKGYRAYPPEETAEAQPRTKPADKKAAPTAPPKGQNASVPPKRDESATAARKGPPSKTPTQKSETLPNKPSPKPPLSSPPNRGRNDGPPPPQNQPAYQADEAEGGE
ncbi:MAG: DUF669 domain-containing protein [Deltaproteobacteria bacterium]|jgi:hypothetical protein|nr:DUF669 domain-containing protein [Deltaproteobacteria bacterium]